MWNVTQLMATKSASFLPQLKSANFSMEKKKVSELKKNSFLSRFS
jgi:hypothetical protein